MRRHSALLIIGTCIAALFCIQVFYDIIAVKIALLLGASRPLFHSALTVPEDAIWPRWIPNPEVADEAGNVLFSDFHSNVLVLIRGLSERTQWELSWVQYHLHRYSNSHKATLLAGTPNEITVRENPNHLLLVGGDGVQFEIAIEAGTAEQFVRDVMSTSGHRLPGNGLVVEIARRFPDLAGHVSSQ